MNVLQKGRKKEEVAEHLKRGTGRYSEDYRVEILSTVIVSKDNGQRRQSMS
jgi:hypothetical protein